MTQLVVASKNAGKINEIRRVLSEINVDVLSLEEFGDIPEAPETGATFLENACDKARYYSLKTGKPCLADDSGLEMDILGGAPGVYSARFAGANASDAANNNKLLQELEGVSEGERTARFRCVLAVADGEDILLTAAGTIEGIILFAPRGENGFGYDPLFMVPELGRTMAELSAADKNAISHRGKALQTLVRKMVEDRQ
ncbi:MAG TPA: XTP/dITP diphosphatase [Methylomusa anaerophila]|nr:XTP/dITP diphosphatase [Methylomusa anaerophila]HML88276.1 XTP/dITP diphosphatase [Methylomusa anaerophila]